MSDLISRQAAIDALIEYGNGRVVYISVEEAVRRIEQLPPIHPEPHWIPVTERLPESKEEDLEYPTVLITFENEEIMLGCFYESTKEWGTGEYFDKKCDPIAWMPLPEPYKGVTE